MAQTLRLGHPLADEVQDGSERSYGNKNYRPQIREALSFG
jgi:hypothetical protein